MKTYSQNPNPTPTSGLAFCDAEIKLASPVRMIVLISSPSSDSNLYFHFQPLSKVSSVSPIPTTGIESWIPMQGSLRNFPTIRFEQPISRFFMSGDGGASGKIPNFVLLCSDDIFSIEGMSAGGTIADPLPVTVSNTVETIEQGAANGATGQVTLVANTASAIVAARTTRRGVKVTQVASGNDVYVGVGASAPTLATGDLLPGVKGAWIVIPTSEEVQAISAGTPTLSYLEVWN